MSAARFRAAEILPEATDLRADFELSREGRLLLRIREATVGGGPLDGTVSIDSIDPLGTLVFDGQVAGASLGSLLGGFVPQAPDRVTGPAAVRGRIAVNLGAPVLDASSLRGQLALGADEVNLSGWDLEGALRQALVDKLGQLADVAALIDPDARKALTDPGKGASVSRLLDRLALDVDFDQQPWGLRTVQLVSGGVTLRGQGSFDAVGGAVDLRCTAEMDADLTRRYVDRYSQLRSLVDSRGHLTLPLRLHGPMMQPRVDLELSDLGRERVEDAVRGLLEGLLDR